MSKPMPPTPLRQEDYLAIEAAVMETARGRWFLSEYARRNRNADTDTLLNAIDKLEKSVVRDRAPASIMDRVKMDLADMSSAIEKTKREIAQIKHENNDGTERFERASVELDAIVTQTEAATGDILGAAEKIQEYAWTLREMGSDEDKCNELDAEATNIYMACSFQDLTGQRIQKIVDAMRYVENRINSMIDIWGFESDKVDIDHADIKSHDARPDAHLLNGPQLEGEGVEQGDIDAILNHSGDDLEANQDDVDALFDQLPDDGAVDETGFAAVDMETADAGADVAFVSEDAIISPMDTDDVVAAEELAEAATDCLDLDSLDWAQVDTAGTAEELSAPVLDASIESVDTVEERADMEAADVFASPAIDAVAPVQQTPDPAEEIMTTASEASGDQADVFASLTLDDVEADVFAAVETIDAETSDEIADIKLADLRDRVAEFS